MPRSPLHYAAATGVLALSALTGCGAQTSQPTTDTAQTSESADSSPAQTSAPETSASQQSQKPVQNPSPTASESSAPAELTPLPATSGEANVSAFKAEITDAAVDETKSQTGHELEGSPGIRINLKLTNVTDKPADASILSFPTAELDGTQVSGTSDNEDPAKTVFSTIEPGQSQELSMVFPTESQPEDITVTVQDPANPSTSTTLTHSVTK